MPKKETFEFKKGDKVKIVDTPDTDYNCEVNKGIVESGSTSYYPPFRDKKGNIIAGYTVKTECGEYAIPEYCLNPENK